MFSIKDIKLNSKFDNLNLGVTIVTPESEPKGIVQISHGMSEHRKRYLGFMKFLAQNGYVSIINDHRGHGESIASENDLGYFYKNGHIGIVSDIHQVRNYIKDIYPNLSIVLLGHSMGSIVAREYIKKYNDIDKLILCGIPTENNSAKLGLKLCDAVSLFHGGKYRCEFINNLVLGAYNKGFKTENEWICSDKNVVNEYNNDKNCGFTFTLNGFKCLFKMLIDVYSPEGWNKGNLDLPILMLAGKSDPVIMTEHAFYKTKDFFRFLGYNNIYSKLYDNMRHEILNETEKDKVYNDILRWI